MVKALIVALVVGYLGTGFILSLQVLLTYLSARSAVKSRDPMLKGEGAKLIEDLSTMRGGAWGTMGIILIAPWYLLRLPEGTIR